MIADSKELNEKEEVCNFLIEKFPQNIAYWGDWP